MLWETGRASGGLRFETLSGTLAARPDGDDVLIDLPGQPVRPAALPEEIQKSFATARFVGRTPDRGLDDVDYLIELDTAAAVLDLSPPLDALRRVPGGFIVTARADTGGQDYVCRYFAPWFGIDEDPVTGAAHCALAPYWGARLGREELSGLQASHRPGLVRCRVDGDRVLLMGGAVTVLRGELLH